VLIHGPLGYEPNALPLRHPARDFHPDLARRTARLLMAACRRKCMEVLDYPSPLKELHGIHGFHRFSLIFMDFHGTGPKIRGFPLISIVDFHGFPWPRHGLNSLWCAGCAKQSRGCSVMVNTSASSPEGQGSIPCAPSLAAPCIARRK
jgi:hypothetical protein